ncbi:MAG: hypothetical protein H6656_10270 [Ardenticatenaceae bacterium]|nr:hypothetical protein [Ardenticatenaceae bacterium]
MLTIEPWQHEKPTRQLIRLLAADSQRSCLTQYETCRRLLADRLGVEPTSETCSTKAAR